MMFLKYQLPSEPNVYVDLLDDEDVSLMFDEVRHHCPLCACLFPNIAWLHAMLGYVMVEYD